jgi:hypothetical protein
MVDAAIQMAAQGLRDSVPLPELIFSESFVRSLLKSPMETDAIFERVFDVMGYDIEELLDIGNMPIHDGMSPEAFGYDMEMLSGTFVMGIVLDRYFFTPFGHFLRIIKPMYALPFALYDEVVDYIDVCDDADEAFVAFFAPCSSYTLTELGLQIMNVEKSDENFFDIKELPFDTTKDSIFESEESLAIFVKMAQQLSPLALEGGLPATVHTFRIRLESDTTMWLHLSVPDNFTLEHLYEEIAEYFSLKPNGDFSFFHDKTENRFAEYPSTKRAAKAKSPKTTADKTMLSELDFEHMKILLLSAYGQAAIFANEPPTIRLQLERLSEKDPDLREVYPQIGRMSKKMKQSFDWNYELT